MMGLLTLLDSRTHRNRGIWKEIIRLTAYVRKAVSYALER